MYKLESAEMDLNTLLNFVVLASIVPSSLAACVPKNMNPEQECNYTIVCTKTIESISTINCDSRLNPYFVFLIINITAPFVNPRFFGATNFDAYVNEIVAIGNNWPHINPHSFRYFVKTSRVDISNNNIIDIKNDAFKWLSSLAYLNISNNKIDMLYSKSLVSSEGKPGNPLRELDVSNNKLIELSSELNELTGLKRLHLQNNFLKVADEAFMRLKNLEYLNLRNNQLTSLKLTNLNMLRTLDISYNNLIKLSGYQINRLVAIVYFNASHNALLSVESNCFNQAFSLQKADFSYNKININIEVAMFINNKQLNYLNFYNNNITGLQDNSFKNCRLYYINFANNDIEGDIKESTFTGSHNFTKLDLSRQRISGIRNNAFIDIPGLLYLNLSINNIENIETSSFVNTSITILDLSLNKISDVNFLPNCMSNLSELYLNNNNITVIPKNSFRNKELLIKIDLSLNRIKTIEQHSLPLINLQYFNISGNLLSGTIKKNVFSPAKNLRFLDLSNSKFTKIDHLALIDLTSLEQLDLSNNQIETIESNNFKGILNMYSLDISNNQLSHLIFNNKILTYNLKTLYLNNNNLTNISSLILSKSKLSFIDVSNNNIENLLNLGADKLPNLTVLHLANNEIETFNNPETNTLTSLTDLGLSSNKISTINLSYFEELVSVDLSNNNLSYLNSTWLMNKDFLQSLNLSRNNITDLPAGTFQFLKNLKLLNLSSNYLTTLQFGSLKGLHKTELLDLSRNNITTLEVNVFNEFYELKTLIIDYNHIKTFDIENIILLSLKKLKTLSLGGNPISCTEIIHNIKSTNVTTYTVREVEVTSIHKIYHEDNVHGIKCGEDVVINESTTNQSTTKQSTTVQIITLQSTTMESTTVQSTNMLSDLRKSTVNKADTMMNYPHQQTTESSMTIIIVSVWCSLLTILVLAIGAAVYVKLYKKLGSVSSKSVNMHIRKSVELNDLDLQVDLLR